MCGIAGFLGEPNHRWLREANACLSHRGPDSEGLFLDFSDKLGLAHRRLSILDLSDAGRQPMSTADERYCICYNGELYNFPELRSELESLGHAFRSRTDTEVVLHAWQEWGESALRKFNGIFAFALWDALKKEVNLARDPLGVKPLYWTLDTKTETLFFASELTPLGGLPYVGKAIDPNALDAYLAFLWIPHPLTIYQGVRQLPPGSLLRFNSEKKVRIHQYTDLFDDLLQGADKKSTPLDPGHVWKTLTASVRRQLCSDVPIGLFLSGGVDSTAILAAIEEKSKMTAFTASFGKRESVYEATSNDLSFAQEAAKVFGVRHEILPIQPDITSTLSEYISRMDQPVGDHAPLVSYLICKAASKRVKVLLSGQGADEIFAGYPWHKAGSYSFSYCQLPLWFRNHVIEPFVERLPGGVGGRWLGNLRRLKRFVRNASEPWPERYVALCRYADPQLRDELKQFNGNDLRAEKFYMNVMLETESIAPLAQMLYTDVKTFLPGLNLFYTDRTSMAHGVEVRVPFLDLEMVRVAFQTQSYGGFNQCLGKRFLKQALRNKVPESILARKKAGFGLPIRSWLRGSLASLVHEVLSISSIKRRGLWDSDIVHRLIQEQQDGKEDWAYLIFSLLTLEMWMRTHLDHPITSTHETKESIRVS